MYFISIAEIKSLVGFSDLQYARITDGEYKNFVQIFSDLLHQDESCLAIVFCCLNVLLRIQPDVFFE